MIEYNILQYGNYSWLSRVPFDEPPVVLKKRLRVQAAPYEPHELQQCALPYIYVVCAM